MTPTRPGLLSHGLLAVSLLAGVAPSRADQSHTAPPDAAAPAERTQAPIAPPTGPPELADLPVDSWRQEIDALLEVLTTKHVDPFVNQSREELLARAEVLKASLDELSVPQRLAGMAALAASLGDQHTSVALDRLVRKAQLLPLAFIWLDDGLYVAAAEEALAPLVGRKVVAFAGRSPEEALPIVTRLVAVENEGVRRLKFCQLASSYDVLHAVGLLDPDGRLSLTILPGAPEGGDGSPETVRIEPVPPRTVAKLHARPDERDPRLPISRQTRTGNYFVESLPEQDAVYLRFDRCIEDPNLRVAVLARNAAKDLAALERPRLIVDLRNNMGGDSRVIRPLIEELQALRQSKPSMRDPHAVVVLIGPRTQSSASMNALELKRALGATLVGEPTGQRPSHLGEVRTILLPNTGLTVWYSTKRFDAGGEEASQTDGLQPTIRVPMDAAAWFAGRDPVLEKALELPRSESGGGR